MTMRECAARYDIPHLLVRLGMTQGYHHLPDLAIPLGSQTRDVCEPRNYSPIAASAFFAAARTSG